MGFEGEDADAAPEFTDDDEVTRRYIEAAQRYAEAARQYIEFAEREGGASAPEVLTEPATLADLERTVVTLNDAKRAVDEAKEVSRLARTAEQQAKKDVQRLLRCRAALFRALVSRERGVTALARRAGVSQQHVSRIISDPDAP